MSERIETQRTMKITLPSLEEQARRNEFIRGIEVCKVIIRHEGSLTQDASVQLVLDKILKAIDEREGEPHGSKKESSNIEIKKPDSVVSVGQEKSEG